MKELFSPERYINNSKDIMSNLKFLLLTPLNLCFLNTSIPSPLHWWLLSAVEVRGLGRSSGDFWVTSIIYSAGYLHLSPLFPHLERLGEVGLGEVIKRNRQIRQ
jgi:hypothetical protein